MIWVYLFTLLPNLFFFFFMLYMQLFSLLSNHAATFLWFDQLVALLCATGNGHKPNHSV